MSNKLLKTMFTVAIISLLFSFAAQAQIEFNEIKSASEWEAIVKLAEEQDKLIFLDIYATWCGPCKFLDSNVYPDPELGKYYNANFINAKMDGETEFGKTKVMQYALRAYPTMYYLSPDDQIITTIVGVRQAPDLKAFGEKIITNSTKILEWSAGYESGSLNASQLADYRNLLIEIGSDEKAGMVAGKMLPFLTEKEILDPAYKEIVLTSTSDIDGKVFNAIKNNRDTIKSLWSDEELDKLFSTVFDMSLRKAIALQSEDFRDRIINEFLPVYLESNPAALSQATYITYKLYDANTGNWPEFEKRISSEFEKNNSGNDRFLYAESMDIVNNYPQEPEALMIANRLIAKAIGINPSFDNLVMSSYLAGITGEFSKAREVLSKIELMELTDEQKNILAELRNIVDQAEGGDQ